MADLFAAATTVSGQQGVFTRSGPIMETVVGTVEAFASVT
jgi:hypothetical protein